MTAKHATPLRGLMATSNSRLLHGRFGRMFGSLKSARFGKKESDNENNLKLLGAAMTADFDLPKDGKDDEESGIPALFTYFGQFVDHDLTFDPVSSLQKQNDPDALTDFRSPAFDLDCVYGRGPDDQPYLYEKKKFLLGDSLTGGDTGARDLPRNSPSNPAEARAIIGDPRNDENTIVSQLQGLFLRFHNRIVDDNPTLDMEDIQTLVRYHYQHIVLHDLLPRLVSHDVLRDLKTDGKYDPGKLKFYSYKNNPYMPVEFSVAAYRLGHSMVRPGYRLNDGVLLPIFPSPQNNLPEGLTGFRRMITPWGIDWGRFIDTEVRDYDGSPAIQSKRLQFAYRLDTSLVNPLGTLPPSVAGDPPPSLAERNLLRGWRLGLPTGQDIARHMHKRPLHDADILIGKATDDGAADLKPITAISPVFANNCPLWTYVLAEAMHSVHKVKIPVTGNIEVTTPQLGPVGGRIVAEVFLGLMFADRTSHLRRDPNWQSQIKPNFALRDFVNYALGR